MDLERVLIQGLYSPAVVKNVLSLVLQVFNTPVEDGTYYGITRGGRPGGRAASSSLSGAYLQNNSS